MIMPSSVPVMSAPMAERLFTITSIRLDSLTFNSAASFITVSPSAKQARIAITGISSMSFGMMSPSITQPLRLLVFTVMSAVGSPESALTFVNVISPPIIFITSIIPSLVGLIPTFLMVISEFSAIRPATRKYAAEEISPGTMIF